MQLKSCPIGKEYIKNNCSEPSGDVELLVMVPRDSGTMPARLSSWLWFEKIRDDPTHWSDALRCDK